MSNGHKLMQAYSAHAHAKYFEETLCLSASAAATPTAAGVITATVITATARWRLVAWPASRHARTKKYKNYINTKFDRPLASSVLDLSLAGGRIARDLRCAGGLRYVFFLSGPNGYFVLSVGLFA